MKDFIVVGGGVGGVLTSATLKKRGFETLLLEKDKNLGGSSGSFNRGNYTYNIGATTFAGFHKGTPLFELIEEIGSQLPIDEIDPALSVIQNGKETKRFKDLDRFVDEVNRDYPHTKNIDFWSSVQRVSEEFYSFQQYRYSQKDLLENLISLLSFSPIFLKFYKYIFQNGENFIKRFFGDINEEYFQFIDNQILIVAQKRSRDLNALVVLISLGYTFMPNYYVWGGMGKLFETLSKDIDFKTEKEVLSIQRVKNFFKVETKGGDIFFSKNVVLNSIVFNSSQIFSENSIKKYYQKYEKLNSFQSAFMLYGVLKSEAKLEHHYQIILDNILENSISNAIFISFSDINDLKSAPKGERTFTISIHTDVRFWNNLKREQFFEQRAILENKILELICKNLPIERNEIVKYFSANPQTFQKYINREQLGGVPMSKIFYKLPSNITPFKGIYHVGDTTFPAQGWLGVATGVRNFLRDI
jgi:phytoene dehydrogenase-like protein